MLREQARLFNRITILTDFFAVIVAFILAYVVRSSTGQLVNLRSYLWVLLIIIPVWLFLLAHFGLYASMRTRPLSQILISLTKAHLFGGVITSSFVFFVDPHGLSRLLFSTFLVFSYILLAAEKAGLKGVLHFIRWRGYNTRNLLVVGTDEKAQSFIGLLEQHAGWGLKVDGVLSLDDNNNQQNVKGYPVLGNLNDMVEVCKRETIDEVVFCVPKELFFEVEGHLREMEELGITVRMVLDFYDTACTRQEFALFHNEIPILTLYSKAFDASQLFLKRCLDIIGSFVGVILTAILFPFIAAAVKLDSPGPLLFSQERVGENGRRFRCWKFRSMYVDAEERKKELMRLNEMQGAMFKMKDDPRITRVGKFIRKTSIDELPQFWNVLRGEMSLVGTRPPTPDEVATYENWHRKRICIKPGITGLWQVSGRNQIQDFDEVVKLDLEYIDRWSLWLDIKILLKTFWVVFARQGSC